MTATALRDAFAAEPGVAFAYLFGSMAEGGFGAMSDIDVAVMFSGLAPSMRERLSFHHRLAKIFKRDIDLVILNDARSFELRREILDMLPEVKEYLGYVKAAAS
ncbi:MAG TPA: nucleotidyltransferase domain-containing protein [Rectinemataceae bacterium]|nr:nucleotidyltransferase domain-containing protein [Rectinemataceae bacterium]